MYAHMQKGLRFGPREKRTATDATLPDIVASFLRLWTQFSFNKLFKLRKAMKKFFSWRSRRRRRSISCRLATSADRFHWWTAVDSCRWLFFSMLKASLGLGFCGCDGHFWCLTQVSVGGSYWDLGNSTGLQARDSKGTPSCERVALDDVPCMKPMYSFDWDIHQKNQQELESSCSSKEHKDGQMYGDIEQWHLIYDIWQMIDDRWWYMIYDRW
jgi:hypothetical protein